MSKREKIIIDTDPGIDDTLAILYALSKDSFEVLSVHTVAGNVGIEHTTRNARGILGMVEENDIPVYRGAAKPLVSEKELASDVHGENGLHGYEFEDENLAPDNEKTSLEAYVDILTATEEPVTIVAIGPLTNVAILLAGYPHLKEKIKGIAIMGGSIGAGNATPAAEFNFFADPHAARIVFGSGLPLLMAGLNVTENTYVFEEDLEEIGTDNPELDSFLLDITKGYIDFAESTGIGRRMTPHDVMPFMYMIKPELFETEDLDIIIHYDSVQNAGQSLADTRPRNTNEPNCRVIMTADNEGYRNELISSLSKFNVKKS